MVIIPLRLCERSHEDWSAHRLIQECMRWLVSLFDFIDVVILLQMLLIKMKCLKKRKGGFCRSCDTGTFWCQPHRKLKNLFLGIKQEKKQYIQYYIRYFTYAYVERMIYIQSRLSFSPHAAFILLGCRWDAGLPPSSAPFQQLSQEN